MTLPDLLDLYGYHTWAQERIAAALLALPPEADLQDLGGSFPTARATFAHLAGAEWLWLERWRGGHPTAVPDWVAAEDPPALLRRWRGIDAARSAFFAMLTEADLATPCAFTLLSGRAASHALGDLLFHVANHATYHRGQLAAMLRRLGSPAPATDFLVYRAEVPRTRG